MSVRLKVSTLGTGKPPVFLYGWGVNARQDAKTIKQAVQQYPLLSLVALVAGLNMLQSIDLREQFKTLCIPCHIFLGGLDTLVPDKVALLVKQLNAKVTINVITNASHAFLFQTQNNVQNVR